MLWKHYVFRRGNEAYELWDDLYREREGIRLLYIAGKGFDIRVQYALDAYLSSLRPNIGSVEKAELMLVGFENYALDDDLKAQTKENEAELRRLFADFGAVIEEKIGVSDSDEDDVGPGYVLRNGTKRILQQATGFTDIILDVSSFPRVVYLSLLTGLLEKLVPNPGAENALSAGGVNFQVIVAEDAGLDGRIKAEDPDSELIMIPGFVGSLNLESNGDKRLVWFPVLGENRLGQLERVMGEIPADAEVCPVLPHPSKNPRRAESLLLEYRDLLIERMQTPTRNILYAHESHPFEAYRQLLSAMKRYMESFSILGGCQLVVTPLSSKLMSLGVGLACYEMKSSEADRNRAISIPYAEPKRYVISKAELASKSPELSVLLLTGAAYS